jgi:hypothetical protein
VGEGQVLVKNVRECAVVMQHQFFCHQSSGRSLRTFPCSRHKNEQETSVVAGG